MALVNNGVKVSISDNQVPSGYTLPTPTEFTDQEYESVKVLTVAKADIDESNEVTSFTALVAAINTQVAALVTADYDTAGLTVTIWTDWTLLSHDFTVGAGYYTTDAINYTVTVLIYVKTA